MPIYCNFFVCISIPIRPPDSGRCEGAVVSMGEAAGSWDRRGGWGKLGVGGRRWLRVGAGIHYNKKID